MRQVLSDPQAFSHRTASSGCIQSRFSAPRPPRPLILRQTPVGRAYRAGAAAIPRLSAITPVLRVVAENPPRSVAILVQVAAVL